MSRLTRKEAIKEAGEKAVELVEVGNVDFTNRVTDGTAAHGYIEFSCDVDCKDSNGDDATLMMYVYVDSEIVTTAESLDQIDWDTAIEDAEYEVS